MDRQLLPRLHAKTTGLVVCCLLLLNAPVHAQVGQVRVTGTVTSAEDARPLPGASVIVKGHQHRHAHRDQRPLHPERPDPGRHPGLPLHRLRHP